MDEQNPGTIEQRLMMLGAALVGTNEAAARIVADAMDHIDQLRKQIAQLRAAGATESKPRRARK